jgi:hypothetical protein
MPAQAATAVPEAAGVPPCTVVNCPCKLFNCAIKASICACSSAAVKAEAGAGTAAMPNMVTTVTAANIFLKLLICNVLFFDLYSTKLVVSTFKDFSIPQEISWVQPSR